VTIRTLLTDVMWNRLSSLLPPQKPKTGRPSIDHRRFIEAVLWLARTGAPWRDLPAELMNWRTAWRRLQRWTQAGIWSRVADALRAMAPDAGWDVHLLDSTIIRAHAHAAGARRSVGEQALGRSRGGVSTKLHLRADAHARPVALHLTGCQTACKPDPLSASNVDPLGTRAAPSCSMRSRRRSVEQDGEKVVFVAQARFLKRQLSLPVSRISQWWVSLSRRAVVIFASPKTLGHSPKARLVVTMMEVCS